MPNRRLQRDHLGFVRAVLQDCADYYPSLSSGFERDLSRLESHSANVGDRVFLLDLPAIAKVLDRALDSGVLPRVGIALMRGINTRTTVPRLFQGLWLRIFGRDGCLLSNADPNAIFFLRSLLLGQKKFEKECSKDVLFETVREFYSVDRELPPPSPIWDDCDVHDWSANTERTIYDRINGIGLHAGQESPFARHSRLRPMLVTIQRVADRISAELGLFDPALYDFKHGPGATAEFQRGTGYKYQFPSWNPRLQPIFPREEYAIANSSLLGGGYTVETDLFGNPGEVSQTDEIARRLPPLKEEASRLIAVPKTQKAPRLIAAEPTCNQWTQQNVAHYLTTRIRQLPVGRSVDFRNQTLSRQAAARGSIDGRTATVDLSSASDRVSTWLIERLYRRNLSVLQAFSATRTRYIRQSIDKKSPGLHKLRKFSSMGSALTFPAQSLTFLILLLGIGVHLSGLRPEDYEQLLEKVRVYGDDLVAPVEWVPRVVEVFSYLHLKVNQDKTFSNGKFRESCGLDAWNGHDVSPGYFLKFPNETDLGSVASLVATANNFYLKGLWKTAKWVERLVPDKIRKLIPFVPIGSGAFGFVTASGFMTNDKCRWNKDLQRYEYRTLVAKTSTGTHKHEGFANLLQFFTEEPGQSMISHWESGLFGKSAVTTSRAWSRVDGLELSTFVGKHMQAGFPTRASLDVGQ